MDIARARTLRQQHIPAEALLWYQLRNRLKFRKQYPVGPWFADFACLEKMLIVELDGSQHAQQSVKDAERTRYLENKGFQVLRFWNNAVFCELPAVLSAIRLEIAGRGE